MLENELFQTSDSVNMTHEVTELLIKFSLPERCELAQLIHQISDQLKKYADTNLEICVFSEHGNGLSVLRYGRKPDKSEAAKQSFIISVEWQKWAEEKGIAGPILEIRFIVRGELNQLSLDYLVALRAGAEKLNAKICRKQTAAIWGKRAETQVKWGIVAGGHKTHRLLSEIELFAPSNKPVLILGETGCGKELVASALHKAAPRKGRFFAINCAALPKELIESELFGHKKGSFSGATETREGYFHAAQEGTLFLDEIGEMGLDLQAKLLRVLQESKVRRVGSNVDEEINVRVVAATNQDLKGMVESGKFRKDLYYRLNVLTLKVEPLRNRAEEIPEMVGFLLRKLSEELGQKVSIETEAMTRLLRHDFPGNVRELVNLLEAGAVYAAQSGIIGINHLRINGEIEDSIEECVPGDSEIEILYEPVSVKENLINVFSGKSYDEIQEEVNTIVFTHALMQSKGQINRAAEILGMERSTFSRHIKRMGLLSKSLDESIATSIEMRLNRGKQLVNFEARAA